MKRLMDALYRVAGGVALTLAWLVKQRSRMSMVKTPPSTMYVNQRRWERTDVGACMVGPGREKIAGTEVLLSEEEVNVITLMVNTPFPCLEEVIRRLELHEWGHSIDPADWLYDTALEILLVCRQRGIDYKLLHAVLNDVAVEMSHVR